MSWQWGCAWVLLQYIWKKGMQNVQIKSIDGKKSMFAELLRDIRLIRENFCSDIGPNILFVMSSIYTSLVTYSKISSFTPMWVFYYLSSFFWLIKMLTRLDSTFERYCDQIAEYVSFRSISLWFLLCRTPSFVNIQAAVKHVVEFATMTATKTTAHKPNCMACELTLLWPKTNDSSSDCWF